MMVSERTEKHVVFSYRLEEADEAQIEENVEKKNKQREKERQAWETDQSEPTSSQKEE